MLNVVRCFLWLSLSTCVLTADSDAAVDCPLNQPHLSAYDPPGPQPALPLLSEELAEVWKLEGQDSVTFAACLEAPTNCGTSAQFAGRLAPAYPSSRHLLTVYHRFRV